MTVQNAQNPATLHPSVPSNPLPPSATNAGATIVAAARGLNGQMIADVKTSGALAPFMTSAPDTESCADFVSAVLQSVGLIGQSEHSNSVGVLSDNLGHDKNFNWVAAKNWQPGDVVCFNVGGKAFAHAEIFTGMVNGVPQFIGSNNIAGNGPQKISEGPCSFSVDAIYHYVGGAAIGAQKTAGTKVTDSLQKDTTPKAPHRKLPLSAQTALADYEMRVKQVNSILTLAMRSSSQPKAARQGLTIGLKASSANLAKSLDELLRVLPSEKDFTAQIHDQVTKNMVSDGYRQFVGSLTHLQKEVLPTIENGYDKSGNKVNRKTAFIAFANAWSNTMRNMLPAVVKIFNEMPASKPDAAKLNSKLQAFIELVPDIDAMFTAGTPSLATEQAALNVASEVPERLNLERDIGLTYYYLFQAMTNLNKENSGSTSNTMLPLSKVGPLLNTTLSELVGVVGPMKNRVEAVLKDPATKAGVAAEYKQFLEMFTKLQKEIPALSTGKDASGKSIDQAKLLVGFADDLNNTLQHILPAISKTMQFELRTAAQIQALPGDVRAFIAITEELNKLVGDKKFTAAYEKLKAADSSTATRIFEGVVLTLALLALIGCLILILIVVFDALGWTHVFTGSSLPQTTATAPAAGTTAATGTTTPAPTTIDPTTGLPVVAATPAPSTPTPSTTVAPAVGTQATPIDPTTGLPAPGTTTTTINPTTGLPVTTAAVTPAAVVNANGVVENPATDAKVFSVIALAWNAWLLFFNSAAFQKIQANKKDKAFSDLATMITNFSPQAAGVLNAQAPVWAGQTQITPGLTAPGSTTSGTVTAPITSATTVTDPTIETGGTEEEDEDTVTPPAP